MSPFSWPGEAGFGDLWGAGVSSALVESEELCAGLIFTSAGADAVPIPGIFQPGWGCDGTRALQSLPI